MKLTIGSMCAFNVIIYVIPQVEVRVKLTFFRTGDTIPHVIAYVLPSLAQHAFLRLLVDRRIVIVLCNVGISFPLSLHRDIVKLSKSSSFGLSFCKSGKLAILTRLALVSMFVIVTSVVLRGVAVEPALRGSSLHVFSFIRPGVFEAIGVISFAVCQSPRRVWR